MGQIPLMSISGDGEIEAYGQAMILQSQNASGGTTTAVVDAEETNIGITLNGSVEGSTIVIQDNTVRAFAQTNVLLNNDELGKISKEQRAGHWPVWQTSLRNPDFAAFATSCGGLGL